MKKQIIMLIALLGVSPGLWAHSGIGAEHHGFFATLIHVLTQPDHLLGIVYGSVLALTVIAGGLKIKRIVRQNKKTAVSIK